MIQLQYYNKGLTKTQIEHILNNYNLKYTTITNEINSKLSSLIKTVLNDISPFLENIELLAKEMKKFKFQDNNTEKIELLENKLREKSQIELQLQNDIISLKKEISLLKQKDNQNISIDNLDNKQNNDNNPLTPSNKSKKKNELNNNSKDNKGKSFRKDSDNTSEKSKMSNIGLKTNSSLNSKNKKYRNNDLYMMNMQEITRNSNKYHNNIKLSRNNQTVNQFICVSNKKNSNRNNSTKNIKDKKGPIDLSLTIDSDKKNKMVKNNNNDKNIENKNKNIKNDKKIEEIEKALISMDKEYGEEIEELEIDEQNILQLIEDIKNFEIQNQNV